MTNKIRLEISERVPFADNHKFGSVGPYERLLGRAHFAVDPKVPAQASIVDLDKAPVNADGQVEFAADVCILKPLDLTRGNRRALFGYGNRGNKRELQFFNDAPPSNDPRTLCEAGNGFLMHQGYTVVWGAWQGDLLPGDGRMLLDVPVATDRGAPITGVVRTEFITNVRGITTFPLSGQTFTRSYPTVSRDTRSSQLTKRRYPQDERISIPPGDWTFARLESGEGFDAQGTARAIVASDVHVHLPSGFEPGWIYELVYTGRDPLVLGLGHVAVRDLVSMLRYERADSAGNANPCGTIEKAYAWGRSQTGRCLRDFIYLGFNADARGRKVFDGVLPHVAGGGLMWMNHRFANASSLAGQQYEDHLTPADRFPFSYATSTDHLTGRTDAILKRPETDPLVIHTQSSTEYWQRRGSLVHTDTRGNDLPQPECVRVYLWASSQHFADPNLKEPMRGVMRNYCNVVSTSMLLRAMLVALDRWATEGIAPPASCIPKRADGTLVTMEQWRRQFPDIPGSVTPCEPNRLPLMDFGPEFARGLITKEPPDLPPRKEYMVGVPAVDKDGNEVAGVRAPMVVAPLGTYTGWNLRTRGFGHGAMFEYTGSYIPFPDSAEERRATSDPRLSILERYPTPEDYTRAIARAARALAEKRLMLEEDVQRAIASAANWGRPRHDVRL